MGDINIKDSLVFIMDSGTMNNQTTQNTEKLTHKVTICCTEDDFIRHNELSPGGKANAKRAWLYQVRREHVLETLDLDNPPPVKRDNAE